MPTKSDRLVTFPWHGSRGEVTELNADGTFVVEWETGETTEARALRIDKQHQLSQDVLSNN